MDTLYAVTLRNILEFLYIFNFRKEKKNGRLLSLQISNIKVLNEGGLISERFFTMAKISKKKKKDAKSRPKKKICDLSPFVGDLS